MNSKMILYITTYRKQFLITILASIFFLFCIYPFVLEMKVVKDLLALDSKKVFIGITVLIVIILLLTWGKANIIWRRYKNTYKLEKPPFIYLDCIALFITMSAFSIFLLQIKTFLKASVEFKAFLSLNLLFIAVWLISSFYRKSIKKQKRIEDLDIYSLSDEPIQFAEQDLLGREKFVEDLYEEITNLPFSDSFVFGLHGSWGEGKTSVINLLRNKLRENQDFLIVNFDPWYFKNEEAILTAFYKQIEQTISQRYIFHDLKKTFKKYQKLISSGLSHVGIDIYLSQNDESLEETRQRIESYILQTKKKLIVFIDDIDRLQPEEILLVFKIVRLNAKFKNTIFILSFDENYVSDILDEKWSTSGRMNEGDVNLIHTRTSHAF